MVGGGDLPAERVVNCLSLIAEEVMPVLEQAASETRKVTASA
jgi:hypothetical protein